MPPVLSFAVLITSLEIPTVGSLGQAIAAHKRIPLQDAAYLARRCWGIVDENLQEEEANRLIECLAKAQIKAALLPQSNLVLLPEMIQLIHVGVEDFAFIGKNDKGEQHIIPWNQARVFSAVGLTSATTKTILEKKGATNTQKALKIGLMIATGLPIPMGSKKETAQKKMVETELNFSLTIITGQPLLHFLIPAENINFSYLKERKLYNVMGNFKLVLADLALRSPQAKKSKGTNILLSNQPVSTMGYQSYQDVERECKWLLSLSSL